MENINFKNIFGCLKFFTIRGEDDEFILIKNNYKSGTYLLSELIGGEAKILKANDFPVDNKEAIEEMVKEYYIIQVSDELGEVSDGNRHLWDFYLEDILNDFRITYDSENNTLKHVEIRNKDGEFQDFYFYLNEEEINDAKKKIVANAISDFQKSLKIIGDGNDDKVQKIFIEFYSNGKNFDIHLVLAYEGEYKDIYCDNPAEFNTIIELKDTNYMECVLTSLETINYEPPQNPVMYEIVNDIWKGLSNMEPPMKVTSDYEIFEPLEYD